MKKQLLYFLLLFTVIASATQLHGQTLTGVVTDHMTGESLPGANIVLEGTTQGTVTDIDGNYSLELTPGTHVLIFRFLGYMSEQVEVTLAQGEILTRNIKLYPDIATFDEVVVIGYGSQKKRVVTGSISSVDAEAISSMPVLRVEQAMQGRTAGVLVTQMSGQPGESPTVRIRGAGTTGNAAPLYVVDGLPVTSIDYLNPGDIESIDVLKDAASAAIYGARAANGVVLITTKSGTKGEMRVTYSGYQGIQNVARTIDMLNADQYRMLMNEGLRSVGRTDTFNLMEVAPHNTDWQDALFQSNAPIMNHEVSVSGGTERSTYASSLSFFSQQGIIGGEKSQFDRITARLNTTHEVNNFFSFGNNLAYSHIIRRGVASNQSFNAPFGSALNMDPLTPVFEMDENELAKSPYASEPVVTDSRGRVYGISNYVGAEVVNPLALLESQHAETRVDKIVGNVYGELELLEGLKYRSSFGLDLSYVLFDTHRPLFYLNSAQLNTGKTDVTKVVDRHIKWQAENILSYSRQIGDHNFTGLIGINAEKYNFENLSGFNSMVPVDDPDHVYLNMAMDTAWVALGGAAHNALLSQFARVLYDYQSRYAFTGIIRRDGSSRFGANNRYGIFPSVGVSWIISEENFFPRPDALDIVKLRASWGINGNEDIGNYQFISRINKSRGYIFGAGREIGASPLHIENPDIKWEQSEQFNVAVDFGALNNRLTGSIDYYVKTTKGLLERIPILGHVGNDPPVANVGSVENRGVELELNWRHFTGDLSYSVGANVSYNRNEMTHIGNEEGVLPGAHWAIAGMVTRTEVGLPIAYFYGYKTDGIFQSEAEVRQHMNSAGDPLQPNAKPGDVRFVDVNGDGVIDDNDRTMIGNPTPDWTFGFNASLEYRQFDFSVFLTGTLGNDVFNGMQRQDLLFTNRTTAILDRWTEDNPSNSVPRYSWNDPNRNYRVSDLYIEDGSFLRVKNIQLGYKIPTRILGAIQAHSWRIYVSAENLFTFTRYTGTDPEIGAMSAFDIGIDRGTYPLARTFRLGTSVSF